MNNHAKVSGAYRESMTKCFIGFSFLKEQAMFIVFRFKYKFEKMFSCDIYLFIFIFFAQFRCETGAINEKSFISAAMEMNARL